MIQMGGMWRMSLQNFFIFNNLTHIYSVFVIAFCPQSFPSLIIILSCLPPDLIILTV